MGMTRGAASPIFVDKRPLTDAGFQIRSHGLGWRRRIVIEVKLKPQRFPFVLVFFSRIVVAKTMLVVIRMW